MLKEKTEHRHDESSDGIMVRVDKAEEQIRELENMS
jgi:hypothetical protein